MDKSLSLTENMLIITFYVSTESSFSPQFLFPSHEASINDFSTKVMKKSFFILVCEMKSFFCLFHNYKFPYNIKEIFFSFSYDELKLFRVFECEVLCFIVERH